MSSPRNAPKAIPQAWTAPTNADIGHELYRSLLAEFDSLAGGRRAADLAAVIPDPRKWSTAAVVEELRRLHRLGVSRSVSRRRGSLVRYTSRVSVLAPTAAGQMVDGRGRPYFLW